MDISPNPSLTRTLSTRYRNNIWFYKYRWLWQHEYNRWWALRWWFCWLWRLWRYVEYAPLLWNLLLGSLSHDAVSPRRQNQHDLQSFLALFLFFFSLVVSRITRHGWSTQCIGARNIYWATREKSSHRSRTTANITKYRYFRQYHKQCFRGRQASIW